MENGNNRITPAEWVQIVFWWLFSVAMVLVVYFKIKYLLFR